MDHIKSTRSRRRRTNAADESDDDVHIYEYKQSRHPDREQNSAGSKRSGLHDDEHRHVNAATYSASDRDASDDDAGPVGEDSEAEDDDNQRHPYYNYATEKSDVAVDAKLFFQRHRLDTESESGGSPHLLAKSFTMPAGTSFEGDNLLGRTPSVSSRRSGPGQKIVTAGIGQPALPYQSNRGSYYKMQDAVAAQRDSPSTSAATTNAQARGLNQPQKHAHEFRDPLLAPEGIHGAGAGVGLGSGPDGFAKNDVAIVSEVEAICDKIKHILDLRQGYMTVSNQLPGDDPKHSEHWNIYPAPPEPVWDEVKRRPAPREEESTSASSSLYISDPKAIGKDGLKWQTDKPVDPTPTSPTSAKKRRKAGTAIGEDFDINECEIPGPDPSGCRYDMDDGSVYQVYDHKDTKLVSVPTLRDYYMAVDQVLDIASDGPAKSFAYRRLQYLEGRYQLYTLLNEYEEVAETKKVPHRDFYNVRKVDTHVHHSACMNQKHLLRFIKSKMKKCPDEIVIDRDGKKLTLSEVFESINLSAYDLSIDTLDMHAHTDSFHRFDKFNLKYNPIGQSRLRDIFLKTDNFIKGRYLAEITREVIADLESSKYQMVEWRISIYGRNPHEWDKLAAWVVDNKLFSPNVRWLIQIPRLFSLYKSLKTMENYEQLLQNLFRPLFEVTQDPTSHPKLHIFLQRVIGFDCVDDESKPEKRLYRKFPKPKEWNTKQNPPYGYWIYYLFANMTSLNAWRKRRGFNTFLLRPHCGEAGDIDHLASAVLCCHSISHGITLRKVPLIQYVFYLNQIGIAMSPLSNNALFLTYDRNPFISYFRKGLNVSLSTDDPLQFAFTKEPLIEEYSVAAQIYKLSAIDMCELAKHSVDQCGFELGLKQRWLGKDCHLPGVSGNDVTKCNVPNIREAFRHETLKAEHAFIARYTNDYSHLGRCDPFHSDVADPTMAGLESPRHFSTQVADSIPPAQTARQPASATNNTTPTAATTHSNKATELDNLVKSGRQAPTSPPIGRRRAGSRSSVLSKTPSHPDSIATSNLDADYHISGREPRVFPGVMHEREKRRNSIRTSGVNATTGLGVGNLVGSATWTTSETGNSTMSPPLLKSHGRENQDRMLQNEGLESENENENENQNDTGFEANMAKMNLKTEFEGV